jgi:hypothetical protein
MSVTTDTLRKLNLVDERVALEDVVTRAFQEWMDTRGKERGRQGFPLLPEYVKLPHEWAWSE